MFVAVGEGESAHRTVGALGCADYSLFELLQTVLEPGTWDTMPSLDDASAVHHRIATLSGWTMFQETAERLGYRPVNDAWDTGSGH